MKITQEQAVTLAKVAEPLMRWLHTNCHPHVMAIVESDKVVLAEGIASHETTKFLSQPVYSAEDLKKHWPAVCPDCGWKGLSSAANGGQPIADTGDFSDVTCPDCGQVLEEDHDIEVKHG